MKKRIFSLILSVIMLTASFSALAQSDVQEVSARKITPVPEYAATLLEELGIMSATEANTDREVQRGYLAEILLKLLKIDDGVATGAYYSDVTADSSYAYAIEKMTELGYFRGVGGGIFNPEGYISINDAARLVLQLAGYGIALSNPSVTNEVYENVGVSGVATCRDLAHMIFNVFNMNAMSVTELTHTGGNFSVNKSLTVMGDLFNVYEVKGTVIENDLTGLWGDTTLDENEFVITAAGGNIVLKTGKTDAGSHIGKHLRVFYQYDKDTDTSTVLSYNIERVSGVCDIDLLDFDFSVTTENELRYGAENKKQKVRYDSKTSIIYNGTYYTDAGFSFSNLTGLEGTITVIDNDSDNVADVLVIAAYKTYVVKSVVLSDGRVFSKNTNEILVLDPEEYDKYSLTDTEGKKAYLEDFVPGVVLAVAQNAQTAEKQVIKAYARKESVSGKISSVYEEDGKQIVEIGDSAYELLPYVEVPSAGKYVEAYLSPFGKIAHIKPGEGGDFLFALTTDIVKNQQTREVILKLLTSEDEFKEYPVAENVRIDGDKYKQYNSIYEKLCSMPILKVAAVSYPRGVFPIRYEINGEGKISMIDTPTVGSNEERDSSLTKIDASSTGVLIGELVLGGEVPVKAETPSFFVSGPIYDNAVSYELINDDRYTGCTTMSGYGVPRSFDYAAYRMNTDSKYASFIVTQTDSKGWDPDKNDTIFVLDKISYIYDAESDMVLPRIEGYDAGVKRVAIVGEDYIDTFKSMNLQQGDALRYNTVNGKICKIEYGRATVAHGDDGITIRGIREADYDYNDFTGGYSNLILIYGYVLEREDNLITIAYKSSGAATEGENSGTKLKGNRDDEDLAGDKLVVKIPSNVAVTVYDPTAADEKVYAGTYDEILDYESVGAECSLVALKFRSSSLAEVIVFNDSSLYN